MDRGKRVDNEIINQFFLNSIDLLCIVDEKGYFVKVNPEWEHCLGYEISELEGTAFIDLVHDDDKKETLKIAEEAINKKIERFINRYRDKKGNYHWIEWRSYPMEGMIYASARDITKTVEIEQEKSRVEERCRMIAKLAADYVMEFDIDEYKNTTLKYVSENFEKETGLKPSDIYGREDRRKIFYKDDHHLIDDFMSDWLNKGIDAEVICRVYSRNGLRWVKLSGIPLKDNVTGKVTTLYCAVKDITEIKMAEEALKISENKYRLLFENMTSGFALLKAKVDDKGEPEDFTLLEANREFECIMGIPVAETIGKTLLEVIPAVEDFWFTTFIEVVKTGKSTSFVRYVDKIDKHLEVYVFMQIDDVFGILVNDVTGRINAERELFEAKEKFSQAFQISPDAFSLSRSSDGLIIEANEGFAKLSGYSREELIGNTVYDLNLYNDPSIRKKLQKDLMKKGSFKDHECYFKRKDGSLWLGMISGAVMEIYGEKYMISMTRDITKWKQTEDELSRIVRMLNVLIENVPIALFDLNLEGNVNSIWNPAAEKLFGWKKEEVVGKPLPTVPEFKKDEHRAIVNRVKNGEIISGLDVDRKRKDGQKISYSIYTASIQDAKSNITGSIAALVDITERKKIHEELKKSEELLKGLTQNIPGTVFQVFINEHNELGFNYISENSEKLFDISSNDYESFYDKFVERIPPGDMGKFEDSVQFAIKNFEIWSYEGKYIKRSGETRYFRGIAQPRRTANDYLFDGILLDITDVKIAEIGLKETKELFFSFFNSATDSMSIFNSDLNLIEINKAGEEFLPEGVNISQAIGRNFNDFTEAYKGSKLFENYREVLKTGEPSYFEDEVLMGNKKMWFLTTIFKVGNGLGVVATNISEIKKAEIILNETKDRLESFMNSATDIITIWDNEFRLLDINNTAIEFMLTGKSKSELLGSHVFDLFDQFDGSKTYKKGSETIKSGKSYVVEESFNMGGLIMWFSTSLFKVGNGLGMITSNITLRKEAEEALLNSRKLLIESQRIARLGTWQLDLVTNKLKWNQETYKIFGIDEDETDINLDTFINAIHPEDKEIIQKHLVRSLEIKRIDDFEVRIIRGDGKVINTITAGEVFVDENGNPYRLSGIVQDITDKKEMEFERQINLKFLENLDKVNRAIQSTNDLEQMMNNVLQEVLSIFDCDRAFLLFPNDPEAKEWWVPMECTKPEYPGAFIKGGKYPMNPMLKKMFIKANETSEPMELIQGIDMTTDMDPWKQFGIKSMMAIPVDPKVGKSWQFGIQQCSHRRKWTENEKKLFKEFSRRLSDGLSSLLIQKELRESEQFLNKLFENIPTMIFVKEAENLSFIKLNKAGEQITGFTEKEFLGKNDYDFFPKEEADFFTTKDREVLRSKRMVEIPEETIMTKDKKERILYTKKVPFLDERGKPKFLFGVSEDITERKHTELALRESEARLRSFIDQSSEGVIIINEEGRVEEWNNSAEEITGIRRNDILNEYWWDRALIMYDVKGALENAQSEFRKTFQRILKTGEVNIPNYDMESIRHPSGEIRYIDQKIFTIKTDLGYRIGAIFNDITQRRNAEERLKKLANLHQTILDTVSVGVAFLKERKYVWVNNSYCNILGYQIDELLGKSTLVNYVFQEDYYRVGEESRESFIKGEVYSTEILMSRKDKRQNWIILYGKAINKDDISEGTVWMIHDITERKIAEEKLQESEELYRNLIETSPDGIYLADLDGKIVMCNKHMAELLGYKNINQVIGKKAEEFIESADKVRFQNDFILLKSNSKIDIRQYRYLNKNRESFIGEYRGTIIWDQNGIPSSVMGIVGDVTEKITALTSLKETKELLQSFMESATDSITIWDSELRLVEINDVSMMYFGSQNKKEILLGRKLSEFITSFKNEASDLNNYEKVLKTGTPYITEDKVQMHGKKTYHLNMKVFKVGEGIGVIISDITPIKTAEEEIKILNADLEKRVLHRTSELERANRDLEAFAYSISHDLRAPLRHIDGFTRIMFSNIDNPNEKIENYYEKVKSATKRMSLMIDDLLAFSKLGRKELSLHTIQTTRLILEIIEQFKPETEKYDIQWILKPHIPNIKGDPGLLKLAFENIISNAIKYSSKKPKIIIEIGANKLPEWNEIYFKDNGVGFNMKHSGKLFGVFQRLHDSHEYEGMGIGLANVKQIIFRHNGTVRAESIENEGATFYLRFPG